MRAISSPQLIFAAHGRYIPEGEQCLPMLSPKQATFSLLSSLLTFHKELSISILCTTIESSLFGLSFLTIQTFPHVFFDCGHSLLALRSSRLPICFLANQPDNNIRICRVQSTLQASSAWNMRAEIRFEKLCVSSISPYPSRR